jgi:general secretion pathway protein G
VTLESALERYELDNGRYPATEEGLAVLIAKPPADAGTWTGPYIRGTIPKDPWGDPYGYRNPGTHRKNGFDLWSNGPDGKEGTPDDIANWANDAPPMTAPAATRPGPPAAPRSGSTRPPP